MHISFKIIKNFILLYAAWHVSDTTVSIIRSFLLLDMQSGHRVVLGPLFSPVLLS
jgi:hypothetical protein